MVEEATVSWNPLDETTPGLTVWDDVVCPWEIDREINRPEIWRQDCLVKYNIGAHFKPRRILEIGVRAGYSAYALITGAASGRVEAQQYLGIDNESIEQAGGREPWTKWARHLLRGLGCEYEIIFQDSQALTCLPGTWDLIHVDGDHGPAPACHDMTLAWPSLRVGGVLVIHDASDPAKMGVGRAIAHFLRQLEVNAEPHKALWVDYYHGDCIITKGPVTPGEGSYASGTQAFNARAKERKDSMRLEV